MKPEPLIDTAFLHKLERLAVRWQKSFAGLVGGHNVSRFAGPGQEFLDHRHFHHGDDLRAVNWHAYLRLERMFLKMFQVEPRVPVRLLLDVSESMSTGAEDGGSKFVYARKLAAALCYIGLVRLDAIRIQPFRDGLEDSLVAAGGRHRFSPAVNFLASLECGGRTGYFQMVRQFVSEYPQRGLLIVISDFLDEEDCLRPLQYLADFGQELLLIHLWADEDRTPPWEGTLELHDAETGGTLEINFDSAARDEHAAAFDRYAKQIQSTALRNGGRYVGLSTSMPLEEAVFGPLVASGGIQ
ncbi:MAG TPA: DUF58 domain-containing protein [Bryobacteraceae bacterium]|nr:DUF58 domain-containing protein [Bryobacteraceae bacterium]